MRNSLIIAILSSVCYVTAQTPVLTVTYPDGKSVNPGDELTLEETQKQPSIHFDAEANAKYTLIFADPDAPSRSNHTLGEFRHWLVGNIPGNDIAKGDIITAYLGPAAPPGTGFHRYTFKLYRQEGTNHYQRLPEN
ncbi:hypothetical protein K7432_005420, partial [Basidiobolus ranarum]